MTRRELNRQIARRTGDDLDTINRLGFSVVEAPADPPDDWETQAVDWDSIVPAHLRCFRHRERRRPAS